MPPARDAKFCMGTPTHTAKTVGATSTLLVAANANRRYLLIQNISTERVSLGLGTAAVANQGIVLEPTATGVAVPMGEKEFSQGKGNLYFGAVYGITASGSKVALVTEGA